MIRRCNEDDFDSIWSIINDGARAYRGIVPADRLDDPYMSRPKLQGEIASGVLFYGYEHAGWLMGVMGIQNVQDVQDVTLIRHAYVCTDAQNGGVGAKLLEHLCGLTDRPILIGTWAAATWAIRFYERRGFHIVDSVEKDRLLQRFWNVPERQIETSVVLADEQWRDRLSGRSE